MMTVKQNEYTPKEQLEIIIEHVEPENNIEEYILTEISEYCNSLDDAYNFLQEGAIYWMPYYNQISEWASKYQQEIDECLIDNYWELGITPEDGLFGIFYKVLDFYLYQMESEIRNKAEEFEEEGVF